VNDPQGFPKANVQAFSATHKNMLIDIVLLAYTGCFKYIQRVHDSCPRGQSLLFGIIAILMGAAKGTSEENSGTLVQILGADLQATRGMN